MVNFPSSISLIALEAVEAARAALDAAAGSLTEARAESRLFGACVEAIGFLEADAYPDVRDCAAAIITHYSARPDRIMPELRAIGHNKYGQFAASVVRDRHGRFVFRDGGRDPISYRTAASAMTAFGDVMLSIARAA